MANMVLTGAYLLINAGNLSTYVTKVEINVSYEAKDTTNFGSGGWKTELAGLGSAKLSVDFLDDFAASNLDSILWPYLGTVQTFEVRPTSAARGTSNPAYTGSVLIDALIPISGKVGDVASQSVSWPVTGAVTRATS